MQDHPETHTAPQPPLPIPKILKPARILYVNYNSLDSYGLTYGRRDPDLFYGSLHQDATGAHFIRIAGLVWRPADDPRIVNGRIVRPPGAEVPGDHYLFEPAPDVTS